MAPTSLQKHRTRASRKPFNRKPKPSIRSTKRSPATCNFSTTPIVKPWRGNKSGSKRVRGMYGVGGRFEKRFPLGKKRGVEGLSGGNRKGRSGVERVSSEESERKMDGGAEGGVERGVDEGVNGQKVEEMVDVDGQERGGSGVEGVDEKEIMRGAFGVSGKEGVPIDEEAVRQMVEFTLMYF